VTIPGNVAINGTLTLGSASTTGQLLFHIASSSFTTLLQASSSQASNLTFTLPTTAGAAGQAMLTDGAGNLFFGNTSSSQWLNGTSGTISYSSGSIGINTTTPLALLSVVGSASSTAPLFDIASSSGTSLFRVSPDGTVTVGHTVLDPVLGITAPNVSGPYLGLIATHTETPMTTSAAISWWMNRSAHIARQNIPVNGMRVVWGNYYVSVTNGTENGPGGTSTYKAAVEYPAGTITPCTFGGNATVGVTGTNDAITDPCGPAVPYGAQFFVRLLYTNTAGTAIYSTGGTGRWPNPGNGAVFGTGTPQDLVASGAVPVSSTAEFLPAAIVGYTSNPSVCLTGDSRTYARADTPDFTGATGSLARVIGKVYAYTMMAVEQTTGAQALANYANRSRIIRYCSHVVDAYGINDLNLGVTAANLAITRASLATLWGKPVIGTTLAPKTTSTDSWATTANQSVAIDPSAFNALVRAGINGEIGYFDLDAAVDPLGINKWPVSFVPGATSGSAGFSTADGIHASPAGIQMEVRSGVITTEIIRR
jgi:hypothetical protein